MGLRDLFNIARDTVADVAHSVTEPIKRCPSTDHGRQCANDKNHTTPHEDEEGNTW